MLVLSSPSGAGKTTIAKRLIEREAKLGNSISVTTRAPRPGEIDGKDYFFVTDKEFQTLLENEQLLEHAKVFGHYYGTPKEHVFATLKGGNDIIFDIDWQGTQQLAQFARDDLVSVFILPPDSPSLRTRLKNRAQDTDEVVDLRMNQAANELSHWAEYDYVIINKDLDVSIDLVQKILHVERIRRHRQIGFFNFVNELKENL